MDVASTQLLDRLPERWRSVVAEHLLTLKPRQVEYYEQVPTERLRDTLLPSLMSTPSASEFVLEQLPFLLQAQSRISVIERMLSLPHWRERPDLRAILRDFATNDPADEVAVSALETSRRLDARQARELLRARAERAQASTVLEHAEQRWSVLASGNLLPDFMFQPSPVFAADVRTQPLRAVAFGDTGAINQARSAVPDALLAYAERHPISLGLLLGDNFYPRVERADDPRFVEQWEARYGRLGVPFYAVLGNKDWHGIDCAAAQLAYMWRSSTWRMPASYYSFVAGPVQFFALETTYLFPAQLRWLEQALSQSTATWRIAFGHGPLENRDTLASVLQGRVDAYFGSYASLEHSEPVPGLPQFISGTAGGKGCRVGVPKGAISRFSSREQGFAVFEVEDRNFCLRFVNAAGTVLYTTELNK